MNVSADACGASISEMIFRLIGQMPHAAAVSVLVSIKFRIVSAEKN